METNLRTTKELIFDEQKLVTYISLSKELCIHVNEAKRLLNQIVIETTEKQPKVTLNVCYIISGLKSDNSARTVLCPATELGNYKNEFKTILFEHVYSVSLHSAAVDSAAIVSLTKLDDFPLCSGLIKGNICCKRTPDEIGILKSKSEITIPEKVPVPKKEKNLLTNGNEVKKISKDSETKSAPVIKTETISPNKESSTSKTNIKNGKSKSIAGFFSKSNGASTTKTNKTIEDTNMKTNTNEIKQETVTEKMDVDSEPEEKPVIVKKEPKSASKTEPKSASKMEPKSASKTVNKESTLNQIRKNAKVDKKRKRVLNVLDSDSDEDPFADETPVKENDSEDEIPPTPSNNTVKITSGILNPKKRRKIVDKTYTDEEGYILTRKEEVYESCSDEEVEKPQPVQVKTEKENEQINKLKVSPTEKKGKNSKKKISPPQKGKQATMMNFFKKI